MMSSTNALGAGVVGQSGHRETARHAFMEDINRQFPSYQTSNEANTKITEIGQIIQRMVQDERRRLLEFFFERNYDTLQDAFNKSIQDIPAVSTHSAGSAADQSGLRFNYTVNGDNGSEASGPASDENTPPVGYSDVALRRRHRNGVSGRRVLGSLHSSTDSRGRRRHRYESMNANRPPTPFPTTTPQVGNASVHDDESRDSNVEISHEQPATGQKRSHDQTLLSTAAEEGSSRAMKKVRTREPLKSIRVDETEQHWSPATSV